MILAEAFRIISLMWYVRTKFMANGNTVEAVVLCLGSLFSLWAFTKIWFCRLPDEKRYFVRKSFGAWQLMYAGLGLAIEAMRLYFPYPNSIKNLYLWCLGIIVVVAVCHRFWPVRASTDQFSESSNE